MARSLFMDWLRSCVHLTFSPLGRCLMRTAVLTLLTFWPPAPPLRMVVISRSLSGMSMSLRSASSRKMGATSTPANVVWRLLLALKGDRRTSRCVPFSPLNHPYGCCADPSPPPAGEETIISTLLNPTTSPCCSSSILMVYPVFRAWRSYMRFRSATQSLASVPPAPAVSRIRQGWSSYGPLSSSSSWYRSPSFSSASADIRNSSTSDAYSSSVKRGSSSSWAADSSPPSAVRPSISRATSPSSFNCCQLFSLFCRRPYLLSCAVTTAFRSLFSASQKDGSAVSVSSSSTIMSRFPGVAFMFSE
mmetsp:Transcript_16740/g.34494  ORF Transcript_16740/g.34494 Transcript_16740/m.34494 type:complete len:304 (+) Transcript_16740:496-1407(+)